MFFFFVFLKELLGYELYVPHEYAVGTHNTNLSKTPPMGKQRVGLYDALWEAGQSFGIANAGYKAIDSCRLEKGSC